MTIFDQLADQYQQLTRRPPTWLTTLSRDASPDDLVTTIRDDRPDSTRSDQTLRTLITIGRRHPEALTVVLYALAPRLRTRLARSMTDDYRADTLTDLTFVLHDSALDRPRLAARLVNRAHNRAHKAHRRTHTRGTVNITTISPREPDQLARHAGADDDIATAVANRVDLARFHRAVHTAIVTGQLDDSAWAAYRDHRLRRAVDADAPVCNSHQRTTALRTARKLTVLVDRHLHVA